MTYRILAVCTGNICRSPMAAYILGERLEEAGLADQVTIESAGTTSWEAGEPMDHRARVLLADHGFDASRHRARYMDREMLRSADLVLAMDMDHLAPIHRAGGAGIEERVHLIRAFDPDAGEDLGIRDPWYGDVADFELTYDMITAAADGVVEHVRAALAEEVREA